MDLQGSAIIVTGSARGLGAAVAKLAASKGANVVVNYTKSESEALATRSVSSQWRWTARARKWFDLRTVSALLPGCLLARLMRR